MSGPDDTTLTAGASPAPDFSTETPDYLPRSKPLPLGEPLEPPFGWTRMIALHPEQALGGEAQLALDDIMLIRLIALREAMRAWLYRPDMHGADGWNPTLTVTGEGDCEDWCLALRREAVARGFAREAFRIALCRTETFVAHAVLAVATDRGDFILDLRRPGIWAWADLPYRFLAIEHHQGGFRAISVPGTLADLGAFGGPGA